MLILNTAVSTSQQTLCRVYLTESLEVYTPAQLHRGKQLVLTINMILVIAVRRIAVSQA